MKALSIRQPWANLIASGEKTIETRTWKTEYRGPVLIISSLKPDIYPAGFGITVVDIVGCRPMIKEDEPRACCELYDGAYAWELDNNRRIAPVKIKGKLGIFYISLEIEDLTFI